MSNSQTDAMTTAVKTLEQRAREAAEANVTESKPINKRFYAVGWRDGYLAAAKEAEQEIAALSKVVALADALAGEFERAVASRNPVSGMQVSPSGDFISCAQLPSAIKRMGWWAREIRAAGEGRRLTQTTPEVERLRARVAELEGYLSKAQVALVYFTRVRGDRILDRDCNWLMLDSDMKEAIINAHNKEHND